MAVAMEVGRLKALLSEVAAQGCRWAWIEEGSLLAGPSFGLTTFALDFASERLTPAERPAGREGSLSSVSAPDLSNKEAIHAGPGAIESGSALGSIAGRRTGNFSFVLEGKLLAAKSQRELLVMALTAIERLRPGSLEKLASERGRTKRAVARRRELLYGDAKLAKYAEPIEGGWWVATNNSFSEVEKFIRRAAFHAGLYVEIRRAP